VKPPWECGGKAPFVLHLLFCLPHKNPEINSGQDPAKKVTTAEKFAKNQFIPLQEKNSPPFGRLKQLFLFNAT
jgi:hypothetical protein